MEWKLQTRLPLPFLDASECGNNVAEFVESKLVNLICFHPEYASPTILRADLLSDSEYKSGGASHPGGQNTAARNNGTMHFGLPARAENAIESLIETFRNESSRKMMFKLVPRNPRRDRSLLQSVWVLRKVEASGKGDTDKSRTAEGRMKLAVVLAPHIAEDLSELPFYHPRCFALAVKVSDGHISIEHLIPQLSTVGGGETERDSRMSHHLLTLAVKHISNPTYEKKYIHDVIVPRERFQTKYQSIKERHAKRLCERVFADAKAPEQEKVFEELAIASWLICIWEDMYEKPPSSRSANMDPIRTSTTKAKTPWLGFLDVGCGNGVLVDILNLEGWSGWGFDARARRSWAKFDDQTTRRRLKEMVLIPYMLLRTAESQRRLEQNSARIFNPPDSAFALADLLSSPIGSSFLSADENYYDSDTQADTQQLIIHPGIFTHTSFVISNHGDELTPWTPLLASLTGCSFLVIPCCSHDLSGRKFRAPPPALTLEDRKKGKESAYSSLIEYILQICKDLNANVEKEWLRIPSTRNLGLVGKYPPETTERSYEARFRDAEDLVFNILKSRGGADGWINAVLDLKQKQLQGGILRRS